MVRNVIGLDIGGSKINGIVYDGKNIVRELTIISPRNLEDFKYSVVKLLQFLAAGRNIQAMGVGVAGIVGIKGQIIHSPNMKFLDGVNLTKFFQSTGVKKIEIENDANCFTLAEGILGKGRGLKNFVGITLGTGIGGGIIINKKLHRGAHNSAGEAGHVMADFKYDSEHYFQKARDKKDYKKMGEILGILFANLYNVLDTELIVLGGSVALSHHAKFLHSALQNTKMHLVNKQIKPKIAVSNLKNSGSLGAALLCKG